MPVDRESEQESSESIGCVNWWEIPRAPAREPLQKIATSYEGKFACGIRPSSPEEAFDVYMSENIDEFVRFTNLEQDESFRNRKQARM